MFKTVNYPIRVPTGNRCWDPKNQKICPFFDNDGGHPICGLNIDNLEYDDAGVPKPDKCNDLEEVKP